jgi:phosphopantothenoylcysteine decarboxylase/phosphopantothenate--cysteine ligase
MGVALAKAASQMGANVTLVLGPTKIKVSDDSIAVIDIETAAQMLEVCQSKSDQNDIFIFAAAVADYRPETKADQKIKKKADEEMTIRLVPNPDIAKTLGKSKTSKQVMVGFALETEHLLENAKSKLESKNLDLIVLNDAKQEGAGFGTDTNIVTLIEHNKLEELPLMSKDEVAKAILSKALDLFTTKSKLQ